MRPHDQISTIHREIRAGNEGCLVWMSGMQWRLHHLLASHSIAHVLIA